MRASFEAEKLIQMVSFFFVVLFLFFRFWNYGHMGKLYPGVSMGGFYEKRWVLGFLRFHGEILYPIDRHTRAV